LSSKSIQVITFCILAATTGVTTDKCLLRKYVTSLVWE
jgi:hypothetical protein